jgi:hypothetical protein
LEQARECSHGFGDELIISTCGDHATQIQGMMEIADELNELTLLSVNDLVPEAIIDDRIIIYYKIFQAFVSYLYIFVIKYSKIFLELFISIVITIKFLRY